MDQADARISYRLSRLANAIAWQGRHAEAIPVQERAVMRARRAAGTEKTVTLGRRVGELGSYITHSNNKKPIITGSGLNMGVSVCGGRAYFSSTRDGNSEIYSANLDGSGVKRLTNHPGIDVSPTCGPGGKIAFVSSRHGGPQIFMMGSGGGAPKRLTYKGDHNQTPAFCMDPDTPLLAFSGRGGGGFDIFTLNLKTGEYKRITQGQGVNQDPAFSPDCRMIAFASSRGGMFISNPDGLNQQKVISGSISTIRWSR